MQHVNQFQIDFDYISPDQASRVATAVENFLHANYPEVNVHGTLAVDSEPDSAKDLRSESESESDANEWAIEMLVAADARDPEASSTQVAQAHLAAAAAVCTSLYSIRPLSHSPTSDNTPPPLTYTECVALDRVRVIHLIDGLPYRLTGRTSWPLVQVESPRNLKLLWLHPGNLRLTVD